MYVYMHEFINAFVYRYIDMHWHILYACMYINKHFRIFIDVSKHVCVFIYVHVWIYALWMHIFRYYIGKHAWVYVYAYMSVWIYAYICM